MRKDVSGLWLCSASLPSIEGVWLHNTCFVLPNVGDLLNKLSLRLALGLFCNPVTKVCFFDSRRLQSQRISQGCWRKLTARSCERYTDKCYKDTLIFVLKCLQNLFGSWRQLASINWQSVWMFLALKSLILSLEVIEHFPYQIMDKVSKFQMFLLSQKLQAVVHCAFLR